MSEFQADQPGQPVPSFVEGGNPQSVYAIVGGGLKPIELAALLAEQENKNVIPADLHHLELNMPQGDTITISAEDLVTSGAWEVLIKYLVEGQRSLDQDTGQEASFKRLLEEFFDFSQVGEGKFVGEAKTLAVSTMEESDEEQGGKKEKTASEKKPSPYKTIYDEKVKGLEDRLKVIGAKEGGKYVVDDDELAKIKEALRSTLNIPEGIPIKISANIVGSGLTSEGIRGSIVPPKSVRGELRFQYDVDKGTFRIEEAKDVSRDDVAKTIKKLAETPRSAVYNHFFSGVSKGGEKVEIEEIDYRVSEIEFEDYKYSFKVTIDGKPMKVTRAERLREGGTTTIWGTVIVEKDGKKVEVERKIHVPFREKPTIDDEDFKSVGKPKSGEKSKEEE